MAGGNVFTRPSSISGNCVTSLTSRTLTPAARNALAVPPVEMRSQPRVTKPLAKSTRPVLSETESSAVGISGSNAGFELLEQRDHLDSAGIHDVLHVEHACGECSWSVGWLDGNPPLRDDWATVIFIVHQVDSCAGFSRA